MVERPLMLALVEMEPLLVEPQDIQSPIYLTL
jgi:hypothetical protein